MRKGILVHKDLDIDKYKGETANGFYPEDGWCLGTKGPKGECWFHGWSDVIVGDKPEELPNGDWVITQETFDGYVNDMAGVFFEDFVDGEDWLLENFDDVESAVEEGLLETKTDNWTDFVKECLNSGQFHLIIVRS